MAMALLLLLALQFRGLALADLPVLTRHSSPWQPWEAHAYARRRQLLLPGSSWADILPAEQNCGSV